MRNELKFVEGKQLNFTGYFCRFGTREISKSLYRKTLVIENIESEYCGRKIYIDHVWFRFNRRFIGLENVNGNGVKLSFDGTVKKYYKSGGSIDYTIKNVKNIKLEHEE